MPELPEVETIARGLNQRIAGDVIDSVWLGEKPEPLKSPAAEIASVLEHRRIVQVRHVGKHIVFDLQRSRRNMSRRAAALDGQCIVDLGMTSRLLFPSPATAMAKQTRAVLKRASGREVRFVDPRRFGRLAVVRIESKIATGFAAPGDHPLQSELGAS